MPTKTLYPHTVTQTTGGKYQPFKDKDVIKNNGNGYAESNGLILGKKDSPNRPSTLTCTDFRCRLPTGAVVNKITVEILHGKTGEANQKSCNIQAPTISLLHNNKVLTSKMLTNQLKTATYTYSKKNQAPKMAPDTGTSTFNGINGGLIKNYQTTYDKSITGVIKSTSASILPPVGLTTLNNAVKDLGTYDLPKASILNDTTFGVRIDYPSNTNDEYGKIRIWYVRIKVTYSTSSFAVSMKKVRGGVNTMNYHIELRVGRTSKTDYIPSVTFTSETGWTFKGVARKKTNTDIKNTGTVTQIDAHTFQYKPALSKDIRTSSASVELIFEPNVTYAEGETTKQLHFYANVPLTSSTVTHTATIKKYPEPEHEDPDPYETTDFTHDTENEKDHIQVCTIDDEFEATLEIDDGTWDTIMHKLYDMYVGTVIIGDPLPYDEALPMLRANSSLILAGGTDITATLSENGYMKWWRTDYTPNHWTTASTGGTVESVYNNDKKFNLKMKGTTIGNDKINIYLNYNPISLSNGYLMGSWEFIIRPKESSLTTPSHILMKLSDDELDRLGDGYSYTVQSFLKEVTSDTYVRDWYKNFRIGVFNNPITANYRVITYTDDEGEHTITVDGTDYNSLTPSEIINNAEYWSPCPTDTNTYENLTTAFQYKAEYPVYIIITGDYTEATTMASIKHTEPCIIETATYDNWENNGIYPIPFNNLIDESDTCTLQLPAYQHSSSIILYDFPVDEDFGTTELEACRGISITGNLEQSNQQVLYAKLISPQKETGERSIIISDVDTSVDSDNEWQIGEAGDLFGYSLLDLTNLKNWEIELVYSNLIGTETTNINQNNIKVNFYMETVEHQNIDVYVNGENISFYNAFLTEITIPPGLETNVDYLNVDGTDTNDAYRQNIKEKTIQLEMEVGDGCNLENNTTTLRQLIKLFTNDKDKYNRPIPNQIQFSHYPDLYFEYIMEDSPTIELDIVNYTVKMKLIVPSGTGYSTAPTITNVIGYTQGLTSIEPIITLRPTDETIEVEETVSGQKFHMGYSGDWNNYILELDCANREAHLYENEEDTDPIDLTRYVDFNSDWFRLRGEYQFKGTNCVIQTVSYNERW